MDYLSIKALVDRDETLEYNLYKVKILESSKNAGISQKSNNHSSSPVDD